MDRKIYIYTDGQATLSVHPCSVSLMPENTEQDMFIVVVDEHGTKSFFDEVEIGFDPQEWLMQYKLDNWARSHSAEVMLHETIANDINYGESKFDSP